MPCPENGLPSTIRQRKILLPTLQKMNLSESATSFFMTQWNRLRESGMRPGKDSVISLLLSATYIAKQQNAYDTKIRNLLRSSYPFPKWS